MMKSLLKKITLSLWSFAPVFDLLFLPITIVSAIWFRMIKFWGIGRMKASEAVLFKVGVFPIADHYYEPLFNHNYLKFDLKRDRILAGLDFNLFAQVDLLKKFNYQQELKSIPLKDTGDLSFYYHNGSFPSGDSEFLYSFIRHKKPRKIVEIGSGFSTRMSLQAINKNIEEDKGAACSITCIEPYEMPWLEQLKITVIRKKVEDVEKSFFKILDEGDILFIDSSHVIRPQGDVLCEILEILPLLKRGVFIHFHDIFTPRDYPESWIKKEFRMWNEQYLLEAFLSYNNTFKIIAALNFLKNKHGELVGEKFPILQAEPNREPGSLWLQKVL